MAEAVSREVELLVVVGSWAEATAASAVLRMKVVKRILADVTDD